MLNPNEDRLDYGQVLAPPEGFRLDFAVGTTYSLDLDALVGVSIALGLSEETDSDLMRNPICLLEALRSVGDKVALFCEAGQIHMPNSVTPLYVLLEKMVFQILMPKRRGIARYPSFHPKFWLIRYENKAREILYRVAVLSRNLTFDRSWDVTFAMDGRLVRGERSEKNLPVEDFLYALTRSLPEAADEKKKKIFQMIRDLSFVSFQLDSKEFSDFTFFPVGVHKKSGFYDMKETPLFQEACQELLIMSPFLSSGVIRDFNSRWNGRKNPRYMLITRASSLNRLKPDDCDHFEIYTLKDAVVDGESAISEDGSSAAKQDIHAKVYMTRNGTKADLYLGSLNASHNAISGNVEFMICLHSRSKYLNLEQLQNQLFCGTDDRLNPFQPAQPGTEEEVSGSQLEQVFKDLARNCPTAFAEDCGESYDLTIQFGSLETEYQVELAPLLLKKTVPYAETVVFTGLSALQLTEFYRVTASDGEETLSRILMIPTSGMPEDREKRIISSVVNNKNNFYQYISFLLGDSYVLSTMDTEVVLGQGGGAGRPADLLPPLYEKMLRTAAEDPQRLKEIDYLLKAVAKDGVVPEHFEELYNTFKKAVKLDD